MRRVLLLLCLLAGLWGGLALAAQAPPPPAPGRWVTDGPGLLSQPARDALDRRLQAYQAATGHQVLLWIGASTGGEPLEEWAVRAFAAWKVGRGGKDDGLVLFVLAGDHKVRLEVGYGLEGQVPDAVAARIIQETIVPGLKGGDADGALTAGVDRILKTIGGETAPDQGPRRSHSAGWQPGDPVSLGTKILIGILGFAFLLLVITHPGLVLWFLVDLLTSGSGGSGGGSSGGGFSGGGGSSGGGGASGSW